MEFRVPLPVEFLSLITFADAGLQLFAMRAGVKPSAASADLYKVFLHPSKHPAIRWVTQRKINIVGFDLNEKNGFNH